MASRFKYTLTADDQTSKGTKSAEKRLDGLNKRANRYASAMDKAGKAAQKSGVSGKGGILQTSGAIDQVNRAAGQLSSTVPGLSRYASVFGEVHQAISTAAKGMDEAKKSGSGLSSTLGGVTSGGVVGVLRAITAGAVKMASGWAEGGAQLGASQPPSASPPTTCRSSRRSVSSSVFPSRRRRPASAP